MKRNKIYYYLGTAVAALALAACSDEINIDSPVVKDNGKAVSVVVSDHGFDNANPVTRANDTNEETIEDNKTVMTTTFTDGDSIGVFAITQNDIPLNDTYVNKALYYENGVWKTKAGQEFLYYQGVDYFAYYPYKEGLTIADVDPTNHTATGFFHDYIAAFEPYKDQFTKWRYTRSDLMVGQGSLVGTECQFQMKHVMGLMVIQVPYKHITYTNVNDENNKYEVNVYYTIDETEKVVNHTVGSDPIYRYIVKPNAPEALTGKTFVDENGKYNVFSISHAGVDGGYYKKYVVDEGAQSEGSGVFDNGYIFNQDGTITEDKVDWKTPLGIIAYCGTDAPSEYRHGLVFNPLMRSYKFTFPGTENWCTSSSQAHNYGFEFATDADAIYNSCSGSEYTRIIAAASTSSHNHAAATIYKLNSIKEYLCPYSTTGWFMPAIGQILAVYDVNGIGKTDLYSHRDDWFSPTQNNSAKQLTDENIIIPLCENLNAAVLKFDSNATYYTNGTLFSSSMYNDSRTFRLTLMNSGNYHYFKVDTWSVGTSYTILPFLAF